MGRSWTSGVLVAALTLFVGSALLLFDGPGAEPGHRLRVEATATVESAGLPPAEHPAAVAENRDLDRLMGIVFVSLLLAVGAVSVSLAGIMGSESLFRERRWAVESLLGAPLAGLLRDQARRWRPRLTGGLVGGVLLSGAAVTLMAWRAPWGVTLDPVDSAPLLLAVVLTPLAVLFLALRPIWRLYRAPHRLAAAIRRGRVSEPPEVRFRRTLLVTFQLAVGVALVTASGLLRFDGGAPAADVDSTLSATFLATGDSAVDTGLRSGLFGATLDRLAADPSLVAESLSTPGAWLDRGPETTAANECGRCMTGGMPHPVHVALVKHHVVMPGFFETRGLDVVDGRAFQPGDDPQGEPVAIVNESYARAHFQDGPAVGRSLAMGGLDGEWHRVIGVVSDIPRRGLGQSSSPFTVYFSALQHAPTSMELIARVADGAATADAPEETASVLQAALVGPDLVDLVVARVQPARTELERLQGVAGWLGSGSRGAGWIAGILALLALWAAVAGHVRSRAGELGTRAAVGAGPATLTRLVLSEAFRIGAVGTALGLWGATAVVGLVGPEGGTLFEPLLFGGVGVTFLVAAVAAALPGAVQAARIEPARALADVQI